MNSPRSSIQPSMARIYCCSASSGGLLECVDSFPDIIEKRYNPFPAHGMALLLWYVWAVVQEPIMFYLFSVFVIASIKTRWMPAYFLWTKSDVIGVKRGLWGGLRHCIRVQNKIQFRWIEWWLTEVSKCTTRVPHCHLEKATSPHTHAYAIILELFMASLTLIRRPEAELFFVYHLWSHPQLVEKEQSIV